MLEAALLVPFVLLFASFILAQIRGVRYEMLLGYALDQTAEEIALLIPLGDAIVDGLGAAEVVDSLRDWLPVEAIADQLMTMAADVTSSLVFGTFVHARLDFWLDEAVQASGFLLPSFEKRLALFWRDDGGLILSLRYDVRSAFFTRRAAAQSYVPLWTSGHAAQGEYDAAEEEKYDAIWELSNFDRGAKFRELYGANLPFNFPVLAAKHGSEGVAIKSMDLTAVSYEQASMAAVQIEQHAITLARFDGVTWGDQVILPGEIKTRTLILIIPENAPAYATDAYFSDLAQRLRLQRVELNVVKHGKSGRYIISDEAP